MKKLLNADYWKNAYLLEFKKNGALTDAFTFSVPPENEDFVFPQRKNETKTFGGAVIADYGNDLVQINLSGTTINQELKLIYKSSMGISEMTGEQEIFYLRDLLRNYGKRENLQGKEVYLYSLNGGSAFVKSNPKWWKIHVGQLDIFRSKDKPFCYNYKFTATGEPEVTKRNLNTYSIFEKIANAFNFVNDWYSKVMVVCNEMNDVIDKLENGGALLIKSVSDAINNAYSCVVAFQAACKRYADVINNFVNEVGDTAKDTVSLGDKIFYSGFRYYPTITASLWNSCIATQEAFDYLYETCSNLDEEDYSESSWQSVKELYDDSVSDQDISDVYSTVAHEGIKAADESVVMTCKNLSDLGFCVVPGDMDEDDTVIVTYGYKVVSVTDAETSWDQLAQDYYGDPSLSTIIASYNSLTVENELKAGQSVLIPNLNFAENQISDNEVYNTPDVKDNYGKDLIIKNRDFSTYNGDLRLVEGINNLEQALLNRYSTLIGARIRLEIYGIQAAIGDALKASSALIQASVHQTTVEDPRVDSVEDIQFNGLGDELEVSIIYVDKNGIKQNFGGVI